MVVLFWLVSEIEIVSSSDNDGPILHEEVDYVVNVRSEITLDREPSPWSYNLMWCILIYKSQVVADLIYKAECI